MATQLELLKEMTTVVADSGNLASFQDLKPQDATTNPSLILQAASLPQYEALIQSSIEYAKQKSDTQEGQLKVALDKLAVSFGAEILKVIPGRVSTEIDARLSYDTQGTLAKCKELFALYQEIGINPLEKVLFKIASTWEGIQAAKQLEAEGIHCNLTLMFGFPQAVSCAEANVTLVSPFVGRITDYWKKEKGVSGFEPNEDPGVISVQKIFSYYKKYGYKTIVMGASFRSKAQILALAGCDYLTIAPQLLTELAQSTDAVPRMLDAEAAKSSDLARVSYDEKTFRYEMGKDQCATAKLAEGIVKFAEDTEKLEKLILSKF